MHGIPPCESFEVFKMSIDSAFQKVRNSINDKTFDVQFGREDGVGELDGGRGGLSCGLSGREWARYVNDESRREGK